MDQFLLSSFSEKPKQKYLYCDSCNSLLPAPGFYCVQCDPPEGPALSTEGDLTFYQAILRILLLTLLFFAIVIIKFDTDKVEKFSYSEKETELIIANDEDFKIFFKINTTLANIRSLPNVKTGKVVGKLRMGTKVEVVGTEKEWSKVILKNTQGGKAKYGWIATKLLDSEIN